MNKDAESMDADDNVPSRPQSRAAKDDNEMDATATTTTTTAEGEKEGEEKEGEEEKKEDEPEPEFEILTNPSRVTPQQEKFISFDPAARFVPCESSTTTTTTTTTIKEKSRVGRGFVVLKDQTPEEEVFYVELAFQKAEVDAQAGNAANAGAGNDDDDEPAPPEEFDFDEDD
jgi:26S proteasome regulatory subunit N2